MKKKLIRVGIILGIIILFALTALYNAYVYQYNFLVSLHFILTNILSGIWVLISTPTIAIALMIFIILWWLKRDLPYVLSMIEEVKAGNVSVKINKEKIIQNFLIPQLKKAEQQEPEFQTIEKQQPTLQVIEETIFNEKVLEKLIIAMNIGILRALLRADGIFMNMDEYAKMFNNLADDYLSDDSLFGFNMGCLEVLHIFEGILLDFDSKFIDSPNKEIEARILSSIKLYPDARIIMEKQLETKLSFIHKNSK